MPDPVFLLDKEEWDRIIPLGQAIKDKYILVYELMPSESLFKFALKLQHETGYKIICISTKKQKMNNVIFKGTDRPETFLNYIKNAEKCRICCYKFISWNGVLYYI